MVSIRKHAVNSPQDVMISVLVPTYNEEESVAEVLRKLLGLSGLLPPMEIIVVDDGSTDHTAQEVAKFPSVKYVAHEKNLGKGAALRTAFRVASGEILVVQDADMEYCPSEIPKIVRPILTGQADVVYGSRLMGEHRGMTFSHYVGNKVLSLTTRLLYRASITDVMTGRKCFARKVAESIDLTEDGFEIETEITTKVLEKGWRITEVPINYSKRVKGSAKIRYWDGVSSMVKLFREFFHRLLRFCLQP